mmetsp:Transcript_6633/g.7446  ORF Transcript_6633/g.7446 Transcript_6633/m.7446 type:complete len:244 (-) Transcript_6633:274-1005(-)
MYPLPFVSRNSIQIDITDDVDNITTGKSITSINTSRTGNNSNDSSPVVVEGESPNQIQINATNGTAGLNVNDNNMKNNNNNQYPIQEWQFVSSQLEGNNLAGTGTGTGEEDGLLPLRRVRGRPPFSLSFDAVVGISQYDPSLRLLESWPFSRFLCFFVVEAVVDNNSSVVVVVVVAVDSTVVLFRSFVILTDLLAVRRNLFHPGSSSRSFSLAYIAHSTGASCANCWSGTSEISPFSHAICKL